MSNTVLHREERLLPTNSEILRIKTLEYSAVKLMTFFTRRANVKHSVHREETL